MKKTPAIKSLKAKADDLREEYHFDYHRAKPNRFAAAIGSDSVAVILEPDVAAVFRDPAAVNGLLRSVIEALPKLAPPTLPKQRRRAS